MLIVSIWPELETKKQIKTAFQNVLERRYLFMQAEAYKKNLFLFVSPARSQNCFVI